MLKLAAELVKLLCFVWIYVWMYKKIKNCLGKNVNDHKQWALNLMGQCAILLFAWLTVSTSYAIDSISSIGLKENYPVYPKVDYGTGKKAEIIKLGEYLTHAGDCIACHTNVQGKGKAFAGDLGILTPFGTFYSPNITPDKETGIGKWSEQDFIRAMRDGVSPQGHNYFPVFPYIYYNKVSEQDLQAMWAYFQAIPAVQQIPRKNTVPFPFNWRFMQYGWKTLYFYPQKEEFKYDSSKSAQWNRGAYLVEGLGHCAMCHTPINMLGASKRKYHLTGAFIEGYWAPNITRYGLERASPEEIADVFKKGKLLFEAGRVKGPMADVNHDSMKKLTDADLQAMAIYLKTVESVEPLGVQPSSRPPTMIRGKKIYQKVCVICHQKGAAAAPIIGKSESWYPRVKAGIDELYRHVINGYNAMPPMGACVTCTDADIMAAVDYLVYQSLTTTQLEDISSPPPPARTIRAGEEVYNAACASCHNDGENGAPVIGDKKQWKSLIAKNVDELIHNTITSKDHKEITEDNCSECSTSEIIAAVKYMVERSKTKGDYSLW